MNKGQSDILDRLENAELKGGDKHGLGGDGGDGGGKAEAKEIPKVKPRGGGGLDFLAKKSPEECFHEFDTDHSGLIDYEEFQQMLPRLNIDISEAKTLRYFRMCDEDNSGAIDLDEFKVSLYCMDPVNGNTVGFSPSNLVSPVDAFEMYDEDRSGNIDEDEFALVLEYLGLNITDERQEKMFLHYDKDKSGTISYDEFKIIWLEVVNKKQELENRGVKVGRFESATTVKRKLERIVHDEEQQELKAMAMANQFRQWTNELVRKKEAIAKAKSRRAMELSSALDSAGQGALVLGWGKAVSLEKTRDHATSPFLPSHANDPHRIAPYCPVLFAQTLRRILTFRPTSSRLNSRCTPAPPTPPPQPVPNSRTPSPPTQYTYLDQARRASLQARRCGRASTSRDSISSTTFGRHVSIRRRLSRMPTLQGGNRRKLQHSRIRPKTRTTPTAWRAARATATKMPAVTATVTRRRRRGPWVPRWTRASLVRAPSKEPSVATRPRCGGVVSPSAGVAPPPLLRATTAASYFAGAAATRGGVRSMRRTGPTPLWPTGARPRRTTPSWAGA